MQPSWPEEIRAAREDWFRAAGDDHDGNTSEEEERERMTVEQFELDRQLARESITGQSRPKKRTSVSTPGGIPTDRLRAGERIPVYKFESSVFVPARDIENSHGEDATSSILTSSRAKSRQLLSSKKTKRDFDVSGLRRRKTSLLSDGSWDDALQDEPRQVATPNALIGHADSPDDEIVMNWRMRLARVMDSLIINVLVILVVLIDISTILYFELGVPSEQKDCEQRDTPFQQQLTIFVLGFFCLEITLRSMGKGFTTFLALRRAALWNWFDFTIVFMSVILAIVKYLGDRSWRVPCTGTDKLCPPDPFQEMVAYVATCMKDDFCPAVPPSPYTTEYDQELPAVRRLCAYSCDEGSCEGAVGADGTAIAQNVSSSTRILSRVALGLRILRAFVGMDKIRRIGTLVGNQIRSRASRGVRRFRTMGFDLDLTYVTDRCIAMSAPSATLLVARNEDGYFGLNNARMLARFLAIRHYDAFRMYNLCGETLGDYAPQRIFSQVHRVPIPEGSPPLLRDVLIFCVNAARYLIGDRRYVICLHCSDGKTRTGVMCASWLLFSGHRVTAEDALDLFAMRRSGKRGPGGRFSHGVSSPACRRVVHQVEELLYRNTPISPAERLLRRIIVAGALQKKCYSVVVQCQQTVVYDSCDDLAREGAVLVGGGTGVAWEMQDLPVHGDTKVCLMVHSTRDPRRARRGNRRAAFFWTLHSNFIRDDKQHLSKHEIDGPHKDTNDRLFPAGMTVTTHFAPRETRSSKAERHLTFNTRISRRGFRRRFARGETIVEAGSTAPFLFLVTRGVVAQVVMESWSSSAADAETLIVNLHGEGDIFGAGAFCLGLPETSHVAHSERVEVAVLKHHSHEEMQGSEGWEDEDAGPKHNNVLRGFDADERAAFYQVLCEKLCQQYTSNVGRLRVLTRWTSFDPQEDLLLDTLRTCAIKRFGLPQSEACTYVHRCVVQHEEEPIGLRVIFLSHYLIIDQNETGASIRAPDHLLFHGTQLSDAFDCYPDVQNIVAVLDGIEYECLCGNPAAAHNLLSNLQNRLNNSHLQFERTVLQSRPPVDEYGNHNEHLRELLSIIPKNVLKFREVIVEEGTKDAGLFHIVSGSVLGMKGNEEREVLRAGAMFGQTEFITGARMQQRYLARSKDGCVIIRFPVSLMTSKLASSIDFAIKYYQSTAEYYVQRNFSLLLFDKPSAYVSSEGEKVLKVKLHASQVMLAKLLQLRKSAFLERLDNESIKDLSKNSKRLVLRPGQQLMRQVHACVPAISGRPLALLCARACVNERKFRFRNRGTKQRMTCTWCSRGRCGHWCTTAW